MKTPRSLVPAGLKILIVDHEAMFRDAIASFCMRDLRCNVVGQAASGREALKIVDREQPELVTLDLQLPDYPRCELVPTLRKCVPTAKILALSAHCSTWITFLVEQAGLVGFVDKGSQTTLMLGKAMAALSDGRPYFSRAYQDAKLARLNDPQDPSKLLSDRELEVFPLVGRGMSDEEIGEELHISTFTAHKHRGQLLRKLNIPNSAKLGHAAIEHGFVQVIAARNGKLVII